ncbi:MAG: protein phosphatase CheZ [Ignavibacteriales bacterium]|nr:MAG: protein phosphatase CheZ [Ignavibacteriales bacterium]
MKQLSNMQQIFDKLDDLKKLFLYGEKIIPVIKNLVDFMRETGPLLENINNSIADSTNKIPKASDQIDNVTSATELATTEILDLVDVISNEVTLIEKSLKQIVDVENKREKILAAISSEAKDNSKIISLLNDYKSSGNIIQVATPLLESLKRIGTDVYNITLSLQVQDITAQQLAAVNHLIGSVQEKLTSLITEIEDTDVRDLSDKSVSVPDSGSFNPDARYNSSASRQQLADSLVNQETKKTTQAEIDKFFA